MTLHADRVVQRHKLLVPIARISRHAATIGLLEGVKAGRDQKLFIKYSPTGENPRDKKRSGYNRIRNMYSTGISCTNSIPRGDDWFQRER